MDYKSDITLIKEICSGQVNESVPDEEVKVNAALTADQKSMAKNIISKIKVKQASLQGLIDMLQQESGVRDFLRGLGDDDSELTKSVDLLYNVQGKLGQLAKRLELVAIEFKPNVAGQDYSL